MDIIQDEQIKLTRKEYIKKYFNDRKDKYSEQITCECSKVITRWNISAHKKSVYHIQSMKIKELENKINDSMNITPSSV